MNEKNKLNWKKTLDDAFLEIDEKVRLGESLSNDIPVEVLRRIDSWKYGEYGWESPVNLLVTESWYKWLNPRQDICIIWAKAGEKKIPGGFSIRTQDEKYTVPFVNKFNIYKNFCSRNSGMQGSRALEKNNLRSSGTRIERNSNLGQAVKFDIDLFKNILNDINDGGKQGAENIFKYILEIAIKRKKAISSKLESMLDRSKLKKGFNENILFEALEQIQDPQFVRSVVACFLKSLTRNTKKFANSQVENLTGSKTGADARSGTPGDLWIKQNDLIIFGCEVKDSSKKFGFDILSAVEERIVGFPDLRDYLLITGSHRSVDPETESDPQWEVKLEAIRQSGCRVHLFTINEFIKFLCLTSSADENLIAEISKILAVTLDLKVNTIQNWENILNSYSDQSRL
jgi:hypothetical protein